MGRQLSRDVNRRGATIPLARRRRRPLIVLSLFLLLVIAVLVAALLLVARTKDQQVVTVQATVAALKTAVTGQQAQVAAGETEIVQQQQKINQLQRNIVVTQTPVSQANGSYNYVASFQIDKYSYILYLQWTESSGFIHNGRLLTTDNYIRKGSKAFQFSGVDNNGSYGFTGTDSHMTMTFSGITNASGTFTVTGLPWYVFYGFGGGIFSETLHPGMLQDYNAAVANIADPPR
jgi:hypothetical protein